MEIANYFNTFFTNIGPSLACQVRNDSDNFFYYYLKRDSTVAFKFTKIYEEAILKIIDDFPLKTSSGVDKIYFKQLKYIKLALIKPITLITKQILNTGIFPDKLNIAKEILFQMFKRITFTNYRLISLLPEISKIIKKVINNQLNYTSNNRIFCIIVNMALEMNIRLNWLLWNSFTEE